MIEIDATDKKLGRLASDVAFKLMGKHEPSYRPNNTPVSKVKVTNASKLSLTDKKIATKTYSSFSGYPSGLKKIPMNKVIEKKGIEEVVKNAVKGMLPKNKLQAIMLKNLEVEA